MIVVTMRALTRSNSSANSAKVWDWVNENNSNPKVGIFAKRVAFLIMQVTFRSNDREELIKVRKSFEQMCHRHGIPKRVERVNYT